MAYRNKVFIATSIDGFIADANGGIDWLNSVPNPENSDMGYNKFIGEVDALIMGRNTFETVAGFDIDWPYQKPVFVLSSSLQSIPVEYQDKVELVKGTLNEVLEAIHNKGFKNLYIDGGKTIQSFLSLGLIDDIIISTIPVLLGDGIPLFGKTVQKMDFELIKSEVFLNAIVQSHYRLKLNS